MIKHWFNKDMQTLEVTYLGIIRAEEILDFSSFISNNKNFPRKLKILTDAREASYGFGINTVNLLVDPLVRNLKNYHSVMDAFIHSKPKETAYSQLLEIDNRHSNYVHKVFSTKKAALSWLKNAKF